MIEVRGIPQLIGTRLTLTAHRPMQGTNTEGAIGQTVQFGNQEITRRLIRVDSPCQKFLMETNVPLPDKLDRFSIELVRVSSGFARSRLQKALHACMKNTSKDTAKKTTGKKISSEKSSFSSGSIDSLYERYTFMSAIPSVAEMYPQWLLTENLERTVDIPGQPGFVSSTLSDYESGLTPLPGTESLVKATGYHVELLPNQSTGAPYSSLQEQWIIIRQQRASVRWRCLHNTLEKIADCKGLKLAYADHDYT